MRRLAVLAALVACTDTAPQPSLTGTWEGSAGAATTSLTLTDRDGAITGAGTTGALAVTVTNGARVDRDVTLALSVPELGQTWFVFATLNGRTLSGRIERISSTSPLYLSRE